MGLYLAVFDEDVELEGVEVGLYADFSLLRNKVVEELEGGAAGSQFPTFILHSDCDGEWAPSDSASLVKELGAIGARFRELPPIATGAGWKKDAVKTFGIRIKCLYDCFFDVDGEPLLERLTELATLSRDRGLPILFQ